MELLAVVWAIEHFKNYVYGVKFQVISDHKALALVLKPNRSNKTFSSRPIRWVDRLLPFKFEVIHAPGRVLGFADYLSRHPSEIKVNAVNTEKLWNDWFTVNAISKMNVVSENETTPLETPKAMKLPRAPDSVLRVESEQDAQHAEKVKEREGNQPIKSRESYARRNERNLSAVQNLSKTSGQEKSKMTLNYTSNVFDKINDSYLLANYEADKMLQKVVQLVKIKEGAKISRLPAPWREKFDSFSVDSRNYLYMDKRLVIPTNLRTSIMSSIHYGYPGRDTMLRYISDIWWPKFHREVVTTAKSVQQRR